MDASRWFLYFLMMLVSVLGFIVTSCKKKTFVPRIESADAPRIGTISFMPTRDPLSRAVVLSMTYTITFPGVKPGLGQDQIVRHGILFVLGDTGTPLPAITSSSTVTTSGTVGNYLTGGCIVYAPSSNIVSFPVSFSETQNIGITPIGTKYQAQIWAQNASGVITYSGILPVTTW